MKARRRKKRFWKAHLDPKRAAEFSPRPGRWRADIDDRHPRIAGQSLNVVKGIGLPKTVQSMFHGHIFNRGVVYVERVLRKMDLEIKLRVRNPGEEYVEREEFISPRKRRKIERQKQRVIKERRRQLRLFRLKRSNADKLQHRKRSEEAGVVKKVSLRIPRKRKVSS